MKNNPPSLVWLPADHRMMGQGEQQMPYLILGDKYARAVKQNALAQPVVFPLAAAAEIPCLLELVDGVMLTGSPSNVHPSQFGESVLDTSLPLDGERDALTLSLVKACITQGVPLLGVCRGFQEINVALGGSLHQQVHAVAGLNDHREDKAAAHSIQYAPSHSIRIQAKSQLARYADAEHAEINSLHGQGINRLAAGLTPLAWATDGLVEAFEVTGAAGFNLAVQWHPEWRTSENPFYTAIFQAFGDACRVRHAQRMGSNI